MTDTPGAPDPVRAPPADPPHPVLRTAGTLVERMGVELVEASAQRLVATMPVAGNTQPYGLLHGGASVVLAETLGSVGAALHAGPSRIAVGVDVNATHHRAVREGTVTGTAEPLHLGRTTANYEVVVTDDAGRRVCTARLTGPRRPPPPRCAGGAAGGRPAGRARCAGGGRRPPPPRPPRRAGAAAGGPRRRCAG